VCCNHITDDSIISISTYCTRLQSLKLNDLHQITDTSIISLSTHCTGLQSLDLGDCQNLTDLSIISISAHCTGLQKLGLSNINQITDDSIISISTHCTKLKSLSLYKCSNNMITDKSIIALSTYCYNNLQHLNIATISNITNISLFEIATKCIHLQTICLLQCYGISNTLHHTFKSSTQLQIALSKILPSSTL